jgi:O-antigen/teichoic acid export membrane protein
LRHFFARNLLFVIGINMLVKPVWIFLIDRNVQIRVGHADFGTYTALLNISVIFQIILDFGLNSYNTRTISAEPERIKTLFPTLLSARIALFGLYEGIVLLAGYIMGYRGSELWLLAGTTLLQGLTIILLFVRSNVAALQRFKLDGVLSVTDRLIMIALCSFLLWSPFTANRFKIEWFVLSQIGC